MRQLTRDIAVAGFVPVGGSMRIKAALLALLYALTLAGCVQYTPEPMLGIEVDQGLKVISVQPYSPALNAGDDTLCPDTDQRGLPRPVGAHCDLGAYEAQGGGGTTGGTTAGTTGGTTAGTTGGTGGSGGCSLVR